MSLQGIPISPNQCIGDSLQTINNAFQTLDTRVDSVSTTSTNPNIRVIDVEDNNAAALRVTQRGTSNALVVEDSAHPDSTLFKITNTGQIVVGLASTEVPTTSSAALTIVNTEGTNVGNQTLRMVTIDNSANPDKVTSPALNFEKYRGTLASPLPPVSGQRLGQVRWARTWPDNVNRGIGFVAMEADGHPTSTSVPGRMVFTTTLSGDGGATPRMVITHDGKVGIGSLIVPDEGTSWARPNELLTVAGNISATGNVFSSSGRIGIGTTTPNATLVVQASSDEPGLRVTQEGNGAAILVEDSTHPDSTPFAVNHLGQIVSGSVDAWNPYAGLQLSSNSEVAPNAGVAIRRNQNSQNEVSFLALVKARGTLDSPAAVQNGDALGRIAFRGYDGDTSSSDTARGVVAANIEARVDGVPGIDNMPGRLVFQTTMSGSSQVTERMCIDSVGRVGIGTTTPNATLVVQASSDEPGLRVTQEGLGNALVVEDSAHPDSTLFKITNTGRVVIGLASTEVPPTSSAALTIITTEEGDTGNQTLRVVTINNSSDPNQITGPALNFEKYRGTLASPLPPVSGQRLGQVRWARTWPDNQQRGIGFVAMEADGHPTSNSVPGRMVFTTALSGNEGATGRMVITHDGKVGIGSSVVPDEGTSWARPNELLTVAGNISATGNVFSSSGFYLPRMTVAQRNSISVPSAGLVIYNIDTNLINYHNGTGWRALTDTAA